MERMSENEVRLWQKLLKENEQLDNEHLKKKIVALELENLKLKDWKRDREKSLEQLKKQQLYSRFHSPIGWVPTEDNWNALFNSIEQSNPTFAFALQSSVYLNEVEKKICYLTKIKVKPSAIALLLHLENASIYRKRLYEKLTGCRGGAKKFDEYISNL